MSKITKEKFERYVDVQMSGRTNMFAVRNVMLLSELTRKECLDIMGNYNKYKKEFQGGK